MKMNSAQRIQSDRSPSPQATDEWIDIDEAAKRAGKSRRQIAYDVQRYVKNGMARSAVPPAGGKAKWYIWAGADFPRFARAVSQSPAPFDLSALTGQQRGTLLLREALVKQWRAACDQCDDRTERDVTADFLLRLNRERGLRLSPRTLQLWHSAYRASGRAGLADGRWLKTKPPERDDDFITDLEREFLHPNKPSRRSAWFAASTLARMAGRPTMEYRTACRYLAAIPKPVSVKMRDGDDAFVAQCEPSIERDYSTLHSNEEWCGDHHQCDVI
ncbi:MAG TPA: hypothetical protein VH023_06275, partial [Rhodopila sp.]|nr:hypothetical protein [Rhodopila sp.]